MKLAIHTRSCYRVTCLNCAMDLQSYRAYKWSIKRPQCASQILCTVNEKNEQDTKQPRLRSYLTKVTSFPAAWAVSNKLGTNFWNLYGAIMEHDKCAVSKISIISYHFFFFFSFFCCFTLSELFRHSFRFSSKNIRPTARISTKRRSELRQRAFTANFNL